MSVSDPPLPPFRLLRDLHRRINHYVSRQKQGETDIDCSSNKSGCKNWGEMHTPLAKSMGKEQAVSGHQNTLAGELELPCRRFKK